MTIYEACIRSFHALPIAALLDDKFFCVHGGISPELVKLSDINKVCAMYAYPTRLIDARRLIVSWNLHQ